MARAAAMLAVGYGLGEATAPLTSLVAQIGETLLANSGGWRVRRLSPLAGERDGADRASLKRHLTELCDSEIDSIVVALAGVVVMHAGEPCLVTGADVTAYPEDATLPLSWIRDRMRSCRADRIVIVASLEGPSDDNDWLDALATGRARHLVATERSGGRVLALAALLDGVRGAAIDPKTGTITLHSLSEHLSHVVPQSRLQLSEESETLASSPPLAGPWDARLTSRSGRRVAVDEQLVGTVLPGRFAIVRELARGSFGYVYVARQLSVDRDVAVKVLHGSIAPGSDTGRLYVHEIQSVGRLDHPNIVRIYQADITPGGSLFYAMELLAGRDLQKIIDQDGIMDRERAVALVRQLAAALGAAHEVELVHADVKPANMVVVPGTPDERLVLLDFGLARLRGAVDSAGGTPAYMAPEQLREGRVDACSDVFSAALVLVTLLTGWRRRTADQLVPPLDGIEDPTLRAVLAKALALTPADRYHNGRELAAALGDRAQAAAIASSPPFRHLAAFTEHDRGRLYGRDREIETLVEHVLFRRTVVYTAPSGTGKTSLLRAGLVPRLKALGVACVYVACHGREPPDLARAIWHEGATPAAAATLRIASEHKRLVVVVDQVEAALANDRFVASLRELERVGEDLELGVVFSVREDVLASLLAQRETYNVLRLGPLLPEGAREAIVGPLIERRVTIEEPLLAVLLADLERAASLIAAEMRWSAEHVIYPPHLQLACSVLYDHLAAGEELLALRHYEQLGGLDEIVRDYLDRVLETELPAALVGTARRVLLALIDSDRTRAVRSDGELAEQLPEDTQLAPVLEVLRQRGIIVPLRGSDGEPAWELVHDSLVPRVLAWSDRQDLARQRALEIVRHHLRGSRGEQPSLLTAAELREVRDHAVAIEELDREWQKRGPVPWTPVKLVAKSRRARRDRRLAIVASVVLAVGIAGFLGLRWFTERQQRRQQELLSKVDMGKFVLELRAFDWDPRLLKAIPVAMSRLSGFDWKLFDTAPDDALAPSDTPLGFERVAIATADPLARAWRVEARGGKAVLEVSRPGCAPSVIPLARLPGYSQRDKPPTYKIAIPTCEATHRDTIEIEAGPYLSQGRGEPPIAAIEHLALDDIPAEHTVDVPAFAIDRTEVPNAAYQLFTSPTSSTAVAMPGYPRIATLENAANPNYPVTQIAWWQARAYCRFLGKNLPNDAQWEKAMRGGLTIHGRPNPMPRRTVPWGIATSVRAYLKGTGDQTSAAIDATPGDVSPYGVLNLAGNVQEWSRKHVDGHFYETRGCSWGFCDSAMLPTVLAVPNMRPAGETTFDLGFRCVIE
ncbi:MAG TPA: bifunctional serine/threonine-protein kinase/formylglycine-generating enzyme family protein [Kofleriaceae bacterium]